MNRDALRPIVLAVVCAIAIVLASATLTSTTTESQGQGTGVGGGSGIGASDGEGVDVGGANASGLIDLGREGSFGYSICVEPLRSPLAVVGIVLGLLVMALVIKRRVGTVASVGLTMSVSIPVTLVYIVLTSCGAAPAEQAGLPELFANRSAGGGGAESAAGDLPSVPVDVPAFVYVVVALGLLAVIVATLADREALDAALAPVVPGRGDPDPDDDPDDEAPAGTYAIGRAAGRAADRIETGTDVENEVYRAWVEMTRHLEVDHPESSTPLEFARAAEAAGMDRDDVDELTEQFERVRYGGAAVTEERERRAVAALRRIEESYAGASVDADTDTDTDTDRDGGER